MQQEAFALGDRCCIDDPHLKVMQIRTHAAGMLICTAELIRACFKWYLSFLKLRYCILYILSIKCSYQLIAKSISLKHQYCGPTH